MFYVSSIKGNLIGIMDTYDNVEEFYSPSQIKKISKSIEIKGVSPKGIKKINLGKALLTREIVKEIDCKKALSFDLVDNLAEYKLYVKGKVINDDFLLLESDTNIKLISDKIIMLDNSVIVCEYKGAEEWEGIFQRTHFTKIDFHNTDTSSVKNMNSMFAYCDAKSLDLSNFNIFNVENTGDMFFKCHATSLDLSSFNTSNVKDMRGMFAYCDAKSLDLSNFNTSNVECMNNMFFRCYAEFINLSSFNTSSVKSMSYMFSDCHAKSLDLSSFNTSNVKDMEGMFKGCQATSLDLSSFNTYNVETMECMFMNCQAKYIDLSSFNTYNVVYMRRIFGNYKGTIKSNNSRILKAYNDRG